MLFRLTMLTFARRRLAQIEEKLAALTRMRAEMATLVATLGEDAMMVCPASRAKQESDTI